MYFSEKLQILKLNPKKISRKKIYQNQSYLQSFQDNIEDSINTDSNSELNWKLPTNAILQCLQREVTKKNQCDDHSLLYAPGSMVV